jgi:beta-fructofuranosidase
MLYEPARTDRYLWDTWLLWAEGRYHLFHMQKVAGEPDSLEIGHAVSDDLVRWSMLAPALTLGPAGAWDRLRFRTGTVVRQDGRYHLFYGAAPDMIDRVGVATSTDLVRWERYSGNPVALADPRWYEHDATARPTGAVAWRDPCIVRDGDGWVMYLAARLNAGPPGGRGTVATLRSRDLLRWEVGPPLDVPRGYAVMEVPDVFELDGRWFLLHSTSHRMGSRFPTCDPRLTAGTFVLWAHRREGPYERPPRDVLVGSPAHRMTAYVARTAETPLGRIAYYHNAYPPPGDGSARRPRGSVALPKALAVDAQGLTLRYLPLLEPYRRRALAPPLVAAAPPPVPLPPGDWRLDGDAAEGRVAYGTAVCLLEGAALDALLTTTVTVDAGQAAGLGLRVDGRGRGLAVILDARAGTVDVAELAVSATGAVWRSLASRAAPVRPGTPLPLRLVVLRDTLDVFLDDALLLSVVAEGYDAGGVALIADDARVRFERFSVYPLAVRDAAAEGR